MGTQMIADMCYLGNSLLGREEAHGSWANDSLTLAQARSLTGVLRVYDDNEVNV